MNNAGQLNNSGLHRAAGPELYQKLEEIRYCEPGVSSLVNRIKQKRKKKKYLYSCFLVSTGC